MTLNALTALSPLDGRYAAKVEGLRIHFSEYGLMRNRVRVEIEWLKALASATEIAECPDFSERHDCGIERRHRRFLGGGCGGHQGHRGRTNHDVKAMEYWLKERLADNAEVMRVGEFIHFGCTSEDINNVSHALMLKDAVDGSLLPALDGHGRACATWRTSLPTCRCWPAPTASRRRRPRWARRWPTSPRA
jgi:adenylosuccinate lyase